MQRWTNTKVYYRTSITRLNVRYNTYYLMQKPTKKKSFNPIGLKPDVETRDAGSITYLGACPSLYQI